MRYGNDARDFSTNKYYASAERPKKPKTRSRRPRPKAVVVEETPDEVPVQSNEGQAPLDGAHAACDVAVELGKEFFQSTAEVEPESADNDESKDEDDCPY